MIKLAEKIKKVKDKIKPIENDLVIVIIIILTALISFGLGRLSIIKENKTPLTIENLQGGIVNSTSVAGAGDSVEILPVRNENEKVFVASHEDKLFVASKNGTKYHYPWCPGALNIKEENKIWFSSKEEAEKSGYTPASNCKGL